MAVRENEDRVERQEWKIGLTEAKISRLIVSELKSLYRIMAFNKCIWKARLIFINLKIIEAKKRLNGTEIRANGSVELQRNLWGGGGQKKEGKFANPLYRLTNLFAIDQRIRLCDLYLTSYEHGEPRVYKRSVQLSLRQWKSEAILLYISTVSFLKTHSRHGSKRAYEIFANLSELYAGLHTRFN